VVSHWRGLELKAVLPLQHSRIALHNCRQALMLQAYLMMHILLIARQAVYSTFDASARWLWRCAYALLLSLFVLLYSIMMQDA
jgi:hypothetical protein